MNFSSILMRIVWRLAPVLWLDWAVSKLISWAIDILSIETERWWLDADKSYAHWFGGWLAVIEARLDELIEARAYQLLKWRWPTRAVPPHSPVLGVRCCEDAWLRLRAIIARYNDLERLAHRRAEKLLLLKESQVIDLIPDHRPIDDDDLLKFLDDDDFAARSSSVACATTSHYDSGRIRAPP